MDSIRFLKTFNDSEKIQPYLALSPLHIDRVKLRVNFKKKRTYGTYKDGTKESVAFEGGRLTYFREMPKEERKGLGYVPPVETYASESYREAIEWAKNVESKVSLFSAPENYFWLRDIGLPFFD